MPVAMHTVMIQDRARAVNDITLENLPVNPISYIILNLRGLAAVGAPALDDLLGHWMRIEVLFKGSAILSLSGQDLWRLVNALWGVEPNIEGFGLVAPNFVRISVPIPFGRIPYWMDEAMPATRSGELQLRVQYAPALTNITTMVETIEVAQILDASPKRFLKYNTVFDQAVAVGRENIARLPIGNPLLGILAFGTTVPDGAFTATLRRMRLLVDNVPYGYQDCNHDSLKAFVWNRLGFPFAYAVNFSDWDHYQYMDFDPLKDGSYALPTEGRADVQLRIESDFADAVRVVPVELVNIAAG